MARAQVPHLAPVPDDNVRDLAILGAGASRAGYREVPVEQLHPHPKNPRRLILETEPEFVELVDSIRAHGILQPGVVVPDPGDPDRYLVITGHRRTAAARVAGLETVPVIVNPDLDDVAQLEAMLIENIARKDLTAVEEADGYQGLLDLGHTVDDVAKKTGRSATTIRRRLQVGHLPEPARAAVHEHRATLDDALTLADLDVDDETREALADKLGTADFGYKVDSVRREQAHEAAVAAFDAAAAATGARVVEISAIYSYTEHVATALGVESMLDGGFYDLPRAEQWGLPTAPFTVLGGVGPEDLIVVARQHAMVRVFVFGPPTDDELAGIEQRRIAAEERSTADEAWHRHRAEQEEQAAREAAEWAQFSDVSAGLRREFLRRLIDSKAAPGRVAGEAAAVVEFVAARLVDQTLDVDVVLPVRITDPDEPDLALTWLGADVPTEDELDELGDDLPLERARDAAATRTPWQNLLALAAASYEPYLEDSSHWPADAPQWRHDIGYTHPTSDWYALLERLGYEPSTVEREHLTPPAPEPVPDVVVDDVTNDDTDHDEEA